MLRLTYLSRAFVRPTNLLSRSSFYRYDEQKPFNHIRFTSVVATQSVAQNENTPPWMTSKVPAKYWDSVDNQRKFMEWAAEKLNITDLSGWYKVSPKDLISLGGSGLIREYNNKFATIFTHLYPDYPWLEWQFVHTPRDFWTHPYNQRRFLEYVAEKLNITDHNVWYHVTEQDIIDYGGKGLLSLFENSVCTTLINVFPELPWEPWLFDTCPPSFWRNPANHKSFMDWVGRKLEITKYQDWYHVTAKDIATLGGGALLSKYNQSFYSLITTVYPKNVWLPWKFAHLPKMYWESIENQRKYLLWMEKQLNISQKSDWYSKTTKEVRKISGSSGIMSMYNSSISTMLETVFPNYKWQPYRFKSKVPAYAWENILVDREKRKEYVDWLIDKLQIKAPEDWFELQSEQLTELKKRSWSLMDLKYLACEFYPALVDFDTLEPDYCNLLTSIFDTTEVLRNYCDDSGNKFDYYIPDKKLAIDFQGSFVRYVVKSPHLSNTKIFCEKAGITYVQVPYYWDRKSSSLAATVYKTHPHLFPKPPDGTPIPPALTKAVEKNLLTSSSLFTPTGRNLSEWWSSPLISGMKCYWTGNKFISKERFQLFPPSSFANTLPNVPLLCILKTKDTVPEIFTWDEASWNNVEILVLDIPNSKIFEERLQELKELEASNSFGNRVKVASWTLGREMKELETYWQTIPGAIGSYLMETQSLYVPGLSQSLKHLYGVMTMKVLEISPEKGFYCESQSNEKLWVVIPHVAEEESKIVKIDSLIQVEFSKGPPHFKKLHQ